MKHLASKYIIPLSFLLILLLITPNLFANLSTRVKICAVKGTVQTGPAISHQGIGHSTVYTCPLKQSLNRTECRIVNRQTMVETGDNSFGYIEYPSGYKVKVGPNTKLVVAQNNIYVESGTSWYKIEKVSYQGKPKFVVKTPTAIAGIRGTELLVDVKKDGSSTIKLIEGSLEVSDIDQQNKMMMAAGMEVTIPAQDKSLNTGLLNIKDNQKWWTDWPTLVPISEMPPDLDDPNTSTSIKSNLIADSHVYAYSYLNWNKANWGKYEILGAGWNPIGGEKRAYLKFDVSGIDKSTFEKASLRLFHYHTAGGNSAELGVYTVRNSWNEGNGNYKPSNIAQAGEICWVNQPQTDQYPVAYFNPGAQTNDFVEVDITALVKSWLNGMPNHGLAIKAGENYLNGPESVYGFYAKEHEDPDKHPQLIINGIQNNASFNEKPATTSVQNTKVEKINSFDITNKGGRYAWEHTQNISIPGEGAVVFEALTTADLIICFAENITDRNALYEIVIGAFHNTKSIIRKGAQNPLHGHVQVEASQTPRAVIAGNQWITYWASVKDGLVMYGRGKVIGQNAMLEWQDPNPLTSINKIGFSSWNAPIKFRNVQIYSSSQPARQESKLTKNWEPIVMNDAFTVQKSSGVYSWEYPKNTKISGNTAVTFDAKGTTDLILCFAEEADNKSAMYEAVIGGWGNTQTVIRKFRQNPHHGHVRVRANENINAMVQPNVWASYWLSVNNGLVQIGRGNVPGQNITLQWQDPINPLEFISTIGFMCWNVPYEVRNLKIIPLK